MAEQDPGYARNALFHRSEPPETISPIGHDLAGT